VVLGRPPVGGVPGRTSCDASLLGASQTAHPSGHWYFSDLRTANAAVAQSFLSISRQLGHQNRVGNKHLLVIRERSRSTAVITSSTISP
jgi:hypothetical protein